MLPREDFKELLVTAFVLLSIDLAYIYSKSDYFKRYFEKIQGSPLKTNPLKAMMAYILLVIGLYYFVIREKKPITYAFLLGVFVYGVYDLTNYATLKIGHLDLLLPTLYGVVLYFHFQHLLFTNY